ncbi:hypothetical protein D3C71_1885970 [compost metagenome]
MICIGTGQEAVGSVNCGNKARNSRKTLGFRPLTQAPLKVQRAQEPDAWSSPARGVEGCKSMLIPSQSRYAAPATVSIERAMGLLATRPPTPAATISVANRCPINNPATAGITTRPTRPAGIA